MHIAIIGAGPAGIEAALAARQAGAAVTVFSSEPVLPYFRPRLVSVAMGQVEPAAIAMHPAAWYGERGIRLRLATPVTAIDVAARTVAADGAAEAFDAIVLSCGALPIRPRLTGETAGMPLHSLWSVADAGIIRQRVRPEARLVVIGGACLGIECALRAREQQMHVEIVEQKPRLMPLLLGDAAAAFLRRQLESRGITVHAGCAVASVAAASGGRIGVGLSHGSVIDADLVLVCIGAAPNTGLARQAGLDAARGILADACLQAAPGIFVAGDACQAAGRPARGAVREASAQGRLAGANAAALLAGGALQPFAAAVIPTMVRGGGIEIHAAGQAAGEDVTEELLDDSASENSFRAVTRRADGSLAGVQMINTREGFDALAAQLAACRA
jgi:3-phenylpropionate/trans-cinnamate dioxygenase ferredoxin reductase subunit